MPYYEFRPLLTQISPVPETFGRNILVANRLVSRNGTQPGVDVKYEAKILAYLAVSWGTLR
jgi:hypothetical protein